MKRVLTAVGFDGNNYYLRLFYFIFLCLNPLNFPLSTLRSARSDAFLRSIGAQALRGGPAKNIQHSTFNFQLSTSNLPFLYPAHSLLAVLAVTKGGETYISLARRTEAHARRAHYTNAVEHLLKELP